MVSVQNHDDGWYSIPPYTTCDSFFSLASCFCSPRQELRRSEQIEVRRIWLWLLPWLVTAASAFAAQHDPASCASNAACLKNFYNGYKATILTELDAYRMLENQIGRVLSTYDVSTRTYNNAAVNELLTIFAGGKDSNPYQQHLNWVVPWEHAKAMDIPPAEWNALDRCRDAIIALKYVVIGMSSQDADLDAERQDVQEYLDSVQVCENYFHLGRLQSDLRR